MGNCHEPFLGEGDTSPCPLLPDNWDLQPDMDKFQSNFPQSLQEAERGTPLAIECEDE